MNDDIAVAQAWNRLVNGLTAICLKRGLFANRDEIISVLNDQEVIGEYLKKMLKTESAKPEKSVPNEG